MNPQKSRIDSHWLLLIMMKQPSAQCQQNQRRKDARQHAGRIQPDVRHLTAASRRKELDGLVRQSSEHTAQHGHCNMLQRMAAVDPHTQHEQKALQRILAEMGHLAHDVHGQAVGKARMTQTAQDALQQHEHSAALAAGHICHRHGVGKDERNTAGQCQREQHLARDRPRGGAFCIFAAQISPEP